MRAYSPGGTLNALAATPKGLTPPASSVHRLQLGLPGYLILFAPLAFEPQRQYWTRKPPSQLVFFQISTHSTATPGIPFPSSILKKDSIKSGPQVEPGYFTPNLPSAYAPFTPSDSEQRLPPTYYRGCWHVVSRSFLEWYRHVLKVLTPEFFFPLNRGLQPEGRHPSRGVAASDFRPLRKIPYCCLP